MAVSEGLRKYLNSESARKLLASDNVTEFLLSSFALIPYDQFRELVEILVLKYDDIFGEINELIPGLFMGSNSVGNVSLNGNITMIPSQCFQNSTIKSIDSNMVTTIASRAFSNCTHLTKAELSHVEIIGSGCFSGCDQLTTVNLPNSLKKIGIKTFTGCASLQKIHYDGTKQEFTDNVTVGPQWDGSFDSSNITIVCTDGEL